MASKKIQAQMQIDVSFIGNTTKLIKDLEQSFSKLNLSSTLTKQIETDLNKGFKDTFANLGKMIEGLSKPGLSTKQYTSFFDSINKKVEDSTKVFGTLKKSLTDTFNSKENKQALKDIEKYKKQLAELNKLASAQKGAATRQNTAINKMREETGIDYNISKRMITNIAGRKANKQELTKTQQDWMASNGLDEASLKRVLELLRQIQAQRKVIEDSNTKAKSISGQPTVSSGLSSVEKNLSGASTTAISQDVFKGNIAILEKYAEEANKASNANTILAKGFETELPRAAAEAEKMAEGMKTLNEVLSQFGIVLSAGTIVRAFKDMITSAFEFYKSLDSALNQIYVVSNLTSGAVDSLKTNFISMAKETGMALDDVTRSAVLFYQQGLNTDEVMIMTEVTSQFAKVAGIDATDAADKLTAAVNGYCLAAEDASLVADKFNKVAAASAADINELSTAFSKAAAQANQAGVSMDNYLAYIATMEEATREAPENIGTSLKTIFSRMQQVKEGGTTEDGDTDVNKVETALKSVGIQLRDTEGQLRDLEDVFDELGPKWNSLDRNTQAYIGTIIAGTRQQSRFITLMQNWDRVLDLADQSANSAGQQALMHAKAMESIESKVQQFQVAWQEFISNIADSSVFKGVISSLTSLINKVNSGSKPLFLLSTAIVAVLKQVGKLQGPLNKLFSKFGSGAKSITKLNVANLKLAVNYVKSTKEIKKYLKENDRLAKTNNELAKSIDEAKTRQEQIAGQYGLTSEQMKKAVDAGEIVDDEYNSLTQSINDNTQAIQNNRNVMNTNDEAMKKQVPNLEQQKLAFQEVSAGVKNLSIGLASLAMVTDGGISSIAQLASTVLGFVAMAIPAIMELSAAENTSIILLLVKLGPVILAGIITLINLVKILGEALGNQDKKIAESVEKMGDALEKLNNAKAKVKGGESLIKEYETLSQKIYRTAVEQEKLNDIAQQLADSLDLDLIEDEFGNLSISLDQANEKLYKLKEEAKDARKELIETEQEQIEKYDHNGNIDKFYDKYLKAHRSDIRNAVDDIEIGLDTDELATSAANVESIMKNLKNTIIDSSAEIAEAFGGAGIHWSLTEDIQSIIDSFNNANIDSSQWNSLFQTFDSLQDKVDTLSYDKALEVVEAAIASWGKAAGLTTEQVNMMKDSIMSSLYGDSNLHKTISKYQQQLDKYSGADYNSKKADYSAQKDDAWERSRNNGEWDNFNPFYESDEEAEYEAAKKKLKLLEAEENHYREIRSLDEIINNLEGPEREYWLKYRNQLAEEYGILSYEEQQRAEKMNALLKGISESTAEYFNNAGLFDEDAEDLLMKWDEQGIIDKIQGAFQLDEATGKQVLTDELVNIINTTDDKKLKEVAQNKLNNVFDSIQISATMSWGNLSDELDDISSNLRSMNNIMEEFNEEGGLSLDTFADLCDILDSIDLSTVFDTGMMEQYIGALDQLQLGFDAATGMITANGNAMEGLRQIQEVATKAKIQQTITTLETDKAALQSKIYGVEAEIAANNALIQWLQKQSDVEIEIDKVKEQGQVDYNNTMQQAATLTAQQYQDMTRASSKWAEAGITNAAMVGDAIKKAMTGELGQGNLKAYLDNLVSGFTYESTGSYNELLMLQKKNAEGKNVVNRDAAIKALQEYNKIGQNTINDLYSQMKSIDSMIGLMNSLKDADLSKLGAGKGDSKEVEKYIGQLKEIYNILNRIQVLEHRLSTLDSYADIATGEMYGDLLGERLEYNKELLDQYEFLTTEQKKFTNGYKDFIQSVEGLEGVFDFDKFGQIIINWDKYTALQDEAVDGEITLKEKADDVYETYTQMFEDLHGYFDKTIDYYQAVIEIQEEQIDAYISMEEKAADAVKEIYQKILDDKLAAIDKEKEALEDLREARERANKDTSNAKTISGMQTDIQRAMMDTSGASDIALIKAQDDMNSKLEEIAEDKYSEMLDNIIASLDEEQEALQEEFDELWENMDWLFSWLDEEVMRDDERLSSLLTQTEEWNTSSQLQREKLLDEWDTSYHTYMKGLQNGATIMDVWTEMKNTKAQIATLDSNLQTSVSKASSTIATTIANWQSKASSSGSSSGGSGGAGNSSSSTKYNTSGLTSDYSPTITGKDSNLKDTSKKEESIPESKYNVGDKLRSAAGWGLTSWKENNGSFTQNGSKYVMMDFKYQVKDKKYDKNRGMWFYYLNTVGPAWFSGQQLRYKQGGFSYETGPAWLDGTKQHPEAVLNALQTEHFIKFTNALDNIYGGSGQTTNTSSVNIESISFNVDSMSSAEDGEKAFNMFVNKFKEIGNQTGIKINSFKNTL